MNLRPLALVGFAAFALGGTAAAQMPPPAQVAQVPPPSITPGPGARRRGNPEPSPTGSETPEPPQFTSMDGVWEVASQPLDRSLRVSYTHLYITQHGDQLTGTWLRKGKPKDKDADYYEFTGTFDGRLFKINLKNAKGIVYTMSGYAENYSDMVGLLTSADPKDHGTPFTAAHRKSERFIMSALPGAFAGKRLS